MRFLPIGLAGLAAGLSVFLAAQWTAHTDVRRSIALSVLAITLACGAAWVARRTSGAGAAAGVWLAIAPLSIAVGRVLGRHVDITQQMMRSGYWYRPNVRGALEWRIDAPVAIGLWRLPTFVAVAWAVAAMAVALAVAILIRTRFSSTFSRVVVACAWASVLASIALTTYTIARERGRVDPFAWARALPATTSPSSLEPCDSETEQLCLPMFLGEQATTALGFPRPRPHKKYVLVRDRALGVHAALGEDQVAIFHPRNEPAKVPPVTRVPLVHRATAPLFSVVALLLLLSGGRALRRENQPLAYRGAPTDEPLRDDDRLVRAAAALALSLLAAAPLLTMFRAGLI